MNQSPKTVNPKPKAEKPAAAKSSKKSVSTPSDSFPIVGIGASAGGLEALEQFLSPIPAASDMAFVIVQHLDPNRKGIMPELLQRTTPMPVTQVQDQVKIQRNHVYVIPPNYDLSLLNRVLHLFERNPSQRLRLPIDFFFHSLAEDQKEHSIGIILSGMGSDGTLGLQAIKEAGGVGLVQEPTTAKFDGMPSSAINAGLADIIAPADELYARLKAHLQDLPMAPYAKPALDDQSYSGLEKIIILLRTHSGHDFSLYKKSTLYRRIERRINLQRIGGIAQYVKFLQENAQERSLLFEELLIGVTRFFRDPEAWVYLREQVIPLLLASRPGGGLLRVWAAGCSTGEEVYSLGIVFKEALEQLYPEQPYSLQIFATDLDADAIAKARQGVYPEGITNDVTPERLQRFFIKEEHDGYRISKEIRGMVTFAVQNVAQDPPFTKLDLLICRNVLIYMNSDLQKKLVMLFHYSLKPGGILFLGPAETISNLLADQFEPLDNNKWRFYRRTHPSVPLETVDFSTHFPLTPPGISVPEAPGSQATPNLELLADRVLLQQFAPAAVLVNQQGDILYINGRTGRYLEPSAGRANWNILVMAREGLRTELTYAFQQALRQILPESITQYGLRVKSNGDVHTVNLTVQNLREPAALHGMLMVVFHEVAQSPVKRHKKIKNLSDGTSLEQMEHEVHRLREVLQITREEMQTSQEELKSANEELQSTNEEFQSANEELVTSKEEMQSLNEELQTVNAELQARVEELSRTNNDMKNLLDSTDIATLFLDGELRVRRFTTQAAHLIKLIPTDVGRPITDIASELIYADFAADVKEVLQTLVFVEKSVMSRSDRWYNARIMPYRTLDNRIDGVVVTFIDITQAKQLEIELHEAQDKLAAPPPNPG